MHTQKFQNIVKYIYEFEIVKTFIGHTICHDIAWVFSYGEQNLLYLV